MQVMLSLGTISIKKKATRNFEQRSTWERGKNQPNHSKLSFVSASDTWASTVGGQQEVKKNGR